MSEQKPEEPQEEQKKEQTLRDKITERTANKLQFVIYYFHIPVAFSVTLTFLFPFLFQTDIAVIPALGMSWFCIGLIWISQRIEKLDPEFVFKTRVYIGLVFFIIFPQISVIYYLVQLSFQLYSTVFVIIMEFVFYLLYSSIEGVPSNRISYWVSIFSVVSLLGIVYSQSVLASGLTPLGIEVVGAFIGLFAAISLGEIFKATDNYRKGRSLVLTILEELQDVEVQLERSPKDPVPTPVWMAAISDGRVLDLQSKFRKKATTAYGSIHYFNLHRLDEFRKKAEKDIGAVID